MARTRAQVKGDADEGKHAALLESESSKTAPSASKGKGQKSQKRSQPAHKHHEPQFTKVEQEARPTKKIKRENATAEARPNSDSAKTSKLGAVLSAYGSSPLHDLGLSDTSGPTPENILALVFYAMLTSARISHSLAYRSVKCLIEAGYQHLDTLLTSSWQERTVVLTKGGYTHYREKTATGLGELAAFISDKYSMLQVTLACLLC